MIRRRLRRSPRRNRKHPISSRAASGRSAVSKRSLYIHIPFCRSRCLYCGFYSAPYNGALISSYADTLVRQISLLDGEFQTIYIGGGTPSVLDTALLEKILTVLKRFSDKSVEFTIEANPESITPEKLTLFFDKGVNRISIGVQSFDDSKLEKLGRVHDSAAGVKAVEEANRAGFKNISIDLIFGIWDEDIPSWKADLKKAVLLPVKHISCYGLTYDNNTPIKKLLEGGSIVPLAEDKAADMYDLAISYLDGKGFHQYEISNFAKRDFKCRHNFTYWENGQYIGLGPSAVSYVDGTRKEYIHDTAEYIKRVSENDDPVILSEKLSPKMRARETAALKIRTMEGVDFDWFCKTTGFEFSELEGQAVSGLIEDGLIEYSRTARSVNGVRLTRKGILFCDTVSSAFL